MYVCILFALNGATVNKPVAQKWLTVLQVNRLKVPISLDVLLCSGQNKNAESFLSSIFILLSSSNRGIQDDFKTLTIANLSRNLLPVGVDL